VGRRIASQSDDFGPTGAPRLDPWAQEMRDGLTCLRGYAQLALRRLDRQSLGEADLRHMLRILEGETRRVERLVDQLAGPVAIRPKRVDLVPWVRRTVGAVRVRQPARRFNLRTPRRLRARLDASQLEWVATDLIEHAIEHSPPDTPITIALDRNGEGFELSVQDEGPGIERDELGHGSPRGLIRPGAGDQPGGGTELHLAIHLARLAAERMGGSLSRDTSTAIGTRFVVSVPAV